MDFFSTKKKKKNQYTLFKKFVLLISYLFIKYLLLLNSGIMVNKEDKVNQRV